MLVVQEPDQFETSGPSNVNKYSTNHVVGQLTRISLPDIQLENSLKLLAGLSI